jgi:hypothetical protein
MRQRFACLIALFVAGCSESAPAPAAAVDAGAEGAPPGGRVVSLKSNIPGATFADMSESSPGIKLLSLSITYDQTPSGVVRDLGGELQNTGTERACTVSVDVRLRNASGNELDRKEVFGAAPAFKTSSGVIYCLAPGEVGAFTGYEVVPNAVRLSDVARVELSSFVNRFEDAVPHPAAPKILSSSRNKHADGLTYTSYELETGAAALRSAIVSTFYFDADGLYAGYASDLRTEWPATTRWSFETTQGTRKEVARHSTFTSFDVVP